MNPIALDYIIESAEDWGKILGLIRPAAADVSVVINVFNASGEKLEIPNGVGCVETTKDSAVKSVLQSVFNGDDNHYKTSGFCILRANHLVELSAIEDWFSNLENDIVYGDHTQGGIRMYRRSPPVVNMSTPALFMSKRLITSEVLSKEEVSEEDLGVIFSSCVRTIHVPKVLSRVF
jgi:hypothetical protein